MSSHSTSSVADHDWAVFSTLTDFNNEAHVEHLLVMPMLEALGFDRVDIVPKVPVSFTRGTKSGRPFEADIVTYSCAIHDRDTSLMVVEVKGVGVPLEDARDQGESYAFQLRTPVLLVTNGQRLQVWQMQVTQQTHLVLEVDITDITARRADIERVISKQALLQHAQRLSLDKITPTANFAAYESSELARVQSGTISRRLKTEQGDSISSTALLGSYPCGALIIAPSGYGKTVLSQKLLTLAIKNRWLDEHAPLVADIPLIDFAAADCDVVEFFLKRLLAKQPEVTPASLNKALREQGAVFICDGLEYVPNAKREATEHRIRLLRRDFPKCQVFIFSRTSVPTGIDLPRLTLLRLDYDEQRQLIAGATIQNIHISAMPKVLQEVSEVPLLLRRIIDYFISRQTFPSAIDELFEHWLSQLREGVQGGPAAKARLDSALMLFAREFYDRRVSVGDLLQLVESAGLGDEAFENLINSGAVVQTNNSVALVHDALGDYLRSRALLRLPADELPAALAQMQIQDDSLLPALLVSAARSSDHSRMIWKRLETISLRRYVDTVRFAKAWAYTFDAQRPSDISAFLADTVEGIEALLRSYFPETAGIIRANLAKAPFPLEAITLRGEIDFTGTPQLRYTFFPASTLHSCAERTFPQAQQWQTTVDLQEPELTPASGRYWAALLVSNAIEDMVRNCTFKGGPLLANDRSLGRLEILRDTGLIDFSVTDSIPELLRRLEPHADKFAARANFTRGQGIPRHTIRQFESEFEYVDGAFTVRSVIEDLETQCRAGLLTLDCWWLPWGFTEVDIFKDPANAKQYIQAMYSRATALYAEIVSTTFVRVTSCFPQFKAMPFRWEVFIVEDTTARSVYWQWLPVENKQDAETLCWFASERPESRLSLNNERLYNELARLGRTFDRSCMTGGGSAFPSPERSCKDGLYLESPAFSKAISMVYAEITFLFDELTL